MPEAVLVGEYMIRPLLNMIPEYPQQISVKSGLEDGDFTLQDKKTSALPKRGSCKRPSDIEKVE